MYWGRCYYKRWATMTSCADPCCHGSHQCLLQTIYLPSQQPSMSPVYYLPCCHGSYHYVLQMLYITQWDPPVSPADHLPHATADNSVCPFMLPCIFHKIIMYLQVTHKLLKENIHYALWEIQCLPTQYLSAAVTTYNNAETAYVSKFWSGAVFPKHFCSQTPFWLPKISMNFHTLAHVNMECPDDRYPKLNHYISELISVNYE